MKFYSYPKISVQVNYGKPCAKRKTVLMYEIPYNCLLDPFIQGLFRTIDTSEIDSRAHSGKQVLVRIFFKHLVLMLHNVSIVNAARQIAGEGIIHLYRGVLPPLCQKSISVSLMFGVYDKCKKPLLQAQVNPILSTILAAITAGSIECVLLPFERLQTILQHERYHKDLLNMKHAVNVLWKTHGLSEFYRGLVPVLFRNGPSNAMFFLLREDAMERFPHATSTAGMLLRQFTIGAMIGAMCSTVFYPCNVLKVHMQSRIGGPFQSVPSAICEIYRERGSVRAFFRGVHLNYTRSCISWGVINTAYEGLKRVL